jgi:hypothetical protein
VKAYWPSRAVGFDPLGYGPRMLEHRGIRASSLAQISRWMLAVKLPDGYLGDRVSQFTPQMSKHVLVLVGDLKLGRKIEVRADAAKVGDNCA